MGGGHGAHVGGEVTNRQKENNFFLRQRKKKYGLVKSNRKTSLLVGAEDVGQLFLNPAVGLSFCADNLKKVKKLFGNLFSLSKQIARLFSWTILRSTSSNHIPPSNFNKKQSIYIL